MYWDNNSKQGCITLKVYRTPNKIKVTSEDLATPIIVSGKSLHKIIVHANIIECNLSSIISKASSSLFMLVNREDEDETVKSNGIWNNRGLTIMLDGKVGIGTVYPAYKFDVSGSMHCTGTLVQDSDIRLKNINKDILLPLEDIANAPLFEFTYKSDKDKRIHAGTSAQYWIKKNDWFCKKQANGYYDMEIQNLALASAISIAKEFKKYKEETESTIDNMKKEIEELKNLISNINK